MKLAVECVKAILRLCCNHNTTYIHCGLTECGRVEYISESAIWRLFNLHYGMCTVE